MKDYTNLYATAAQVIPVFVLIFAIEAGGFRAASAQSRGVRWYNVGMLLVAGVGELCALVALAGGSPADGKLVVPSLLGALSALGLGVAGLFLLSATVKGQTGAGSHGDDETDTNGSTQSTS